MTLQTRFPTLFEVTRIGEQTSVLYFYDITRYSYQRMRQNIVFEWSCMILSGFRKVLIGNMIVTCLQSSYRANEMHICKLMFISSFHTTRNSTECLFCYKYLFQLRAGSILKRSADKNLSETGRYQDRSHKFFIRKFWVLSILNTDRSGRFALHI